MTPNSTNATPSPASPFYKTGQAAKELSISSHEVRQLCEAGLIRGAKLTELGHFRIPAAEVARLKDEGVPPIPVLPGKPSNGAAASYRTKAVLLGDPSNDAIGSAEKVLTARHGLELNRIEWESTEIKDKLDAHKRDKEKAREEERRAQEREQLARERQAWTQKWAQFALSILPPWAIEAQADVYRAVRTRLDGLEPDTFDANIERLIRAEVAGALRPLEHDRKVAELLNRAVRRLPWEVQREPKYANQLTTQTQIARKEARLRPDAGDREIEALITAALKPCVDAYDHDQRCAQLIRAAKLEVFIKLSAADETRMVEALQKALSRLPIGADGQVLKTTYAEVLAPFRAQITEDQDQKMREDVIVRTPFPSGFTQENYQVLVQAVQSRMTSREVHDLRPDVVAVAPLLVGRVRRVHAGAAAGAVDHSAHQRIHLYPVRIAGLPCVVLALHLGELEGSWSMMASCSPGKNSSPTFTCPV